MRNDIRIAMTVNGELIESGDHIRVTDDSGKVHEGIFLRTFSHAFQPDLMRIRYRVGKEKLDVIGTTAMKIERITDA